MIEPLIVILTLVILGSSFKTYRTYPGFFAGVTSIVFLLSLGVLILTLNASADDRIHIAIIDTGVDLEKTGKYLCYDGHFDYTGMGIQDVNGHGTNIAGILAKNLNTKTHCLQILKWYHSPHTKAGVEVFAKALERASEYKAKYVNMSLSGTDYREDEVEAINKLTKNGTVVAVAAGNDGLNLDNMCGIYPACYSIYNSNYVVVGNYGSLQSNTGKFLTIENGNDVEGFGIVESGTSQATAVYLSKRIK